MLEFRLHSPYLPLMKPYAEQRLNSHSEPIQTTDPEQALDLSGAADSESFRCGGGCGLLAGTGCGTGGAREW